MVMPHDEIEEIAGLAWSLAIWFEIETLRIDLKVYGSMATSALVPACGES